LFDIKNNRPSLCGHCLCPAGAVLFEYKKKYYGVCNKMEHIDKIKERIERGEKLERTANLNYESVGYAIAQTKETYIKFANKHNTYELHKWESNDRRKFFELLVLHYLDCEKAKASNGVAND